MQAFDIRVRQVKLAALAATATVISSLPKPAERNIFQVLLFYFFCFSERFVLTLSVRALFQQCLEH